MPFKRYGDWPNRLSAFLRARKSVPYAYGTNCCAAFARDAIIAITGVDVVRRPLPKSRMAAARFILSGGGRDVADLATRLLGPPLPSPRHAGRGDVVAFEQGGERHLAISAGVAAATPARDGMVWVPRELWCLAWKI